jgi:hypothetical protein
VRQRLDQLARVERRRDADVGLALDRIALRGPAGDSAAEDVRRSNRTPRGTSRS